jgi:hypothetical protein
MEKECNEIGKDVVGRSKKKDEPEVKKDEPNIQEIEDHFPR